MENNNITIPGLQEKPIIITDAVIIGAGPVGLFQVFELGLLEIKAHIIDSLARIGGQCVELYPDKPIYDIPALPICSGQELINNLLKQIKPFQPTFHLNQEVVKITRLEKENLFSLKTSIGTIFITKTIFIAAGVGSFQPRTLKINGIEIFENSQLFYHISNPSQFYEKNIVICGGGDSAIDWTLNFVNKANSIVLIHRRNEFRAAPSSVSKIKMLNDQYKIQILIGQIINFESEKNKLKKIKVISPDGVTRTLELDALLVFFGLSPKLGAISKWGLDIERKQIKVMNTEKFETNIPGIFAVGDINTYPGKKKLILSGFHEAALAAFGAASYIFPNKKINMQYTTTSSKLHRILGKIC